MRILQSPMILTCALSLSLGLGLGACDGGDEEAAPGVACEERGAEMSCATPGEVMLCASEFGSSEEQWSECIPADYECVPGDTRDCPGGGDEAGEGEVLKATCAFDGEGVPYWDEDNCYA